MKLLLIATAVLAVGCKKGAPATPVPDAKSEADLLFDRYIEATGGLEASQSVQNLRIDATVEVPAQSMSMQIVIYEERPDRSRFEATMPMIGTILSGHADGIAWEMNPMTGPVVKTGKQAEQAARSGRLDLFEEYATHWPERRVVGTVEFAGTRCQQVDAVTQGGSPQSMFFAVDTGLYMGSRSIMQTEMGEMPIDNVVEAYEEVDGVMISMVSRQTIGPIETVTRFDSIQTNLEDFPDLTPPQEILDLVSQ